MTKHAFAAYMRMLIISILFALIVLVFGIQNRTKSAELEKKSIASGEASNKYTIVIDAGHGGEDGGAVGNGGTLEKDINLAIALKIGDYFKLTDVDFVFTRTDDVLLYKEGQEKRKKFYDLNNRVEFAENIEHPIVISVHQNKFPVEKYKGLQVYYSENHNDSETIARIIQSNTKAYLQSDNNRQIKPGGNIYLLKNLKCPAMIVECGFLSNSIDEDNLNNPEYQRKIAFIIFSSVMEFLQSENL